MRQAINRALLAVVLSLAVTTSARAGWDEAVTAYERGDYDTAYRELRVFAEQGHAEARFKLGMMYAVGSGVEQDRVQALMWLNLAVEAGVEPARERSKQLTAAMTQAEVEEAELLANALYPVNDFIDWNIVLILSLFMIVMISGCTWIYFRNETFQFKRNLFKLYRFKKGPSGLFGPKPGAPCSTDVDSSLDDFQKIVREFSAITETLDPTEIRDTNDLPYPKEKILDAFRNAIVRAVDDGANEQIETLKVAMSTLAQFQSDVGAALRNPVLTVTSTPGPGIEQGDVKAAARRFSQAFKSDEYQRFLEFWPTVEREASALLAEAQALGQPDSA